MNRTSEGHASAVRILEEVQLADPLMNNVRKYRRSLVEAFPQDYSHAIEIHRPKEPLGWRVLSWTVGLASAALVAMHFAGWLE